MSIKVMTAVWEMALPDSEKLVALALADWADDRGKCWPSVAQLATKCSKSERTIQMTLKSLVNKGHLVRQAKDGIGTTYWLNPRSDCTPSPPADGRNATPADPAPPPVAAPPQPVPLTPAAVAPNTSVNTNTLSDTDASASAGLPQLILDKPRTAKRPCRMPGDWQPQPLAGDTAAMVALWPPGTVDRVLARFRDWAAGAGKNGVKADWQATWRNWIRQEDERYGQSTGNVGGPVGRFAERSSIAAGAEVLRRMGHG